MKAEPFDNETALAQWFALPFLVLAFIAFGLFAFAVATKPEPSYVLECRKSGGEPIFAKRGTSPSCLTGEPPK